MFSCTLNYSACYPYLTLELWLEHDLTMTDEKSMTALHRLKTVSYMSSLLGKEVNFHNFWQLSSNSLFHRLPPGRRYLKKYCIKYVGNE